MTDTAIDRARALLILRETQPILFSDSMNMCDQLADVLDEMVAEVERLTKRLCELCEQEPVAWMTDHKSVCGNGITKLPGDAALWRLEGWRVQSLIRRPEMPS